MVLFAAFIMALIGSLIFMPYREGVVTNLIVFFIVLFMAAISSQFWVYPFGPNWYGVAWLPMLAAVLVFGLLFSIPAPVRKNPDKDSQEPAYLVSISIFTWLLFALLVLSVGAGIYRHGAW